MSESEENIDVKVPTVLLNGINAVSRLEHVDRSELLKQLIEEDLQEKAISLYEQGKISVGKGAEMLEISLREFLQLLEKRDVAINWDSEGIREYLIKSGYLKAKERIIATLKTLKPTITEQYGVESIGVFGSYVKGEQTPKSDIDILVTFKEDFSIGLFKFMELEEFLANNLGSKVDLVSKNALKPHIGKRILEEVVTV
jgi:uncharacterized protein